jgi:phage recombination protein Bet
MRRQGTTTRHRGPQASPASRRVALGAGVVREQRVAESAAAAGAVKAAPGDGGVKDGTSREGTPESGTSRGGKSGGDPVRPILSAEERELVRRTMLNGASQDDAARFFRKVERTGLDPLQRQIYALPHTSKGKRTIRVHISIDGLRVIAERSGTYEGQRGPFYCGLDGEWTDLWLSVDPPAAAKVGILRRGFDEPLWGVARWDDYVATNGRGEPNYMWKSKGPVMLGKCAESLGLRKAFPQETRGLYTGVEMDQAGGYVSFRKGKDDGGGRSGGRKPVSVGPGGGRLKGSRGSGSSDAPKKRNGEKRIGQTRIGQTRSGQKSRAQKGRRDGDSTADPQSTDGRHSGTVRTHLQTIRSRLFRVEASRFEEGVRKLREKMEQEGYPSHVREGVEEVIETVRSKRVDV